MSRRKYKKTKRKLSRKTIHKTRRRTKNRVKKLSKNQSGGMLGLNPALISKMESDTAVATTSTTPAPAPAPATKKRGRFSSSSVSDTAPAPTKRVRSSVSETDSTKRAKSNPPPLSDEELGKLIINSLFKKVTNVSFIQDSSRYGFILYATVPTGTLFDTRNLPLSQVLDTSNINRGIPLQHFCMKISLVLTNSNEDAFENYGYRDIGNQEYDKRALSFIRLIKEANYQKKLHDSFACMRGTSPFVPDVIAHGVFNHDSLESYISLFKANRLAAASETGTAAEIDRSVLHVLKEISEWLEQKNREDSRKTDASEKQNWAVDILLMEYIDTTEYKTLYTLGNVRTWGRLTNIEKALLTSAAQLACATGVGIILYDCHKDNILSNASQEHVVLVDIGGAINYRDEKGDKQFILRTFDTMLGILSGGNPYCSIEQLCNFFGVDTTAAIVKPYKKGKQEPNILTQKLEENLGSLHDFRCREFTIDDIPIDDIHHNLMMTAFIDFMMYIVVHNGNQCQSQYTMESVYGAGTFSNFSTFLTRFRPNERTFRSSGPPPESYDDKLVMVGQEISKIVTLCKSVNCPADLDELSKAHGLLIPSPARPPHAKPSSLRSLPSLEGQLQRPAAEAKEGPSQRRCAIM
jgi:hypothetical protein